MKTFSQVLGALFLFFAVSNLLKGDFDNAAGGLALGGLLLGSVWFTDREDAASAVFVHFIKEQEAALRGGATLSFQNHLVSWETPVQKFQTCFSVLLLTRTLNSRFYFGGSQDTAVIGWAYSLFALVFGWWGIPFGPIYTVRSVYRNIRGGQQWTVGTILLELELLAAEEAEDLAAEAEDAHPTR